jgi:hypothetical protein
MKGAMTRQEAKRRLGAIAKQFGRGPCLSEDDLKAIRMAQAALFKQINSSKD